MESIEKYGIFAVLAGLALLSVALVWHVGRLLWRVFHRQPAVEGAPRPEPKRGRGPLIVMLLGLALLASPYLINFVGPLFIKLGPRHRMVDGEAHVTLTGWNQSNYGEVFAVYPDIVVLQLANADVDDRVTANLARLKKLREIDLNGTKITDQTLETLAGLPKLEVVRLRATAITDDGFRKWFLEKASLNELDLRETAVKSSTAREWRRGKDGRKSL